MTNTVLVLGASGMLGHKMVQVLSNDMKTFGTTRSASTSPDIVGSVRAEDMGSIQNAIKQTTPDVIINCIGIVKQLPEANDPFISISVNSLFPHQLARICKQNDIRLIHISSDCVFSGKCGFYSEDDQSDAEDLYGRTKYLGEVYYPNCLTLRTSIIGRELHSKNGLLEWVLSNENKNVSGYTDAIFSGLTTLELSRIIGKIITSFPELEGLYQVASKPISKYELLNIIKSEYDLNIMIEPNNTVKNNRSLNPSKFLQKTGVVLPSWQYMIKNMRKDVI